MSNAAALAAALQGAVGANHEQQGVKDWLSTGFPPLDYAISYNPRGGMPLGRIVEMYGPESSGKTAIATNLMIEAQRRGGVAWFNDHERSFSTKLAREFGLDTTFGPWVYKSPETFEESVSKTVKGIIAIREDAKLPMEAPIVVVFDSLASMVPKSKMAKDVDEQGMNDSLALAKACSSVFPVLQTWAERYNVLMLFLNQEREKPGVMFGDPTTTPGGKAPKFYSSVRIQLGKRMVTKTVAGKKVTVGQEVVAKCIKNKVSRPFMVAEWRYMFKEDGTGYFDTVGSTLDYLVANGYLEKPSKMIKWTDGKQYHRQKLVDMLLEDPNHMEELIALNPAWT